MATALSDDKKEMEVNVDYPAIRIANIFLHVNPHLHTATHGFEKFILASGNPIKKKTEGFFIVFSSTTARAKFKKNSKWLMGLRKDHKVHKVNSLEVCNVIYNQKRDGFLEPIFKLLFFPPEADSHYIFGEDERLVSEYLTSGSRRDVEVATNVCCDVLGGPSKCTWIGNCCITHTSMLVFGNNVAQAFEKRSLLPQAIMLRELCLAKVHNCRARKSVLPKILHLTQLECLHKILGTQHDMTKVERCSADISVELEKLEQRTSSLSEDNKELTLHSFAFGLHCIKKDLVERGLKHLSTAISVGNRAEIDREEAMVLQAAKSLVSSMMEVAQGGAQGGAQDGGSPLGKGSADLVESTFPLDKLDPEQPPVQNLQESFQSLSINPMPFKLCSSLRKVSDSEIEVAILGAGAKQVNIFEVELFGVDDQQIRWQNTNLQELFVNLEQNIAEGRNFVSVALNSRDEITKLWVKEYNLDDEILSEEKSPATKSVTFSNTQDVFGDNVDHDEEISDNIDTIEILSRPAETEDFVTVGDSVLDEFLENLRNHLVAAKTAGKKNKPGVASNVNVEREADEMVACLRSQADWFEPYLEELFNSWDAKKSRHRLPQEIDMDAIRSHLQENYRQPYSSKFNSQLLLRVTAALIGDEASVRWCQKLYERFAIKEADEDLLRNFKTFYLKRYEGDNQPELEYEEVNKILEDNSVTLTFLEQGWNTQKNFKKFVYGNLSFVKEEVYQKFTIIFGDFFHRFMKLAEGNSRKLPSEEAPEREELLRSFKTFYLKRYQGKPFQFEYEEVTRILDSNSVTIAFLEQGWKTWNNFEKFVDYNLMFHTTRYKYQFTEIFTEFFSQSMKVAKGNARKSPCQQRHEEIITVNDSEDEDTKEKETPQVVYKKNPEFLYVGKLPKDTTKEELEKVFAKYGKVKHVNMKGHYCFVGFTNSDAVKKALKDCPILMRGEHKLNVRENVEKVFVKTEKADGSGSSSKKGEQERAEGESKTIRDVKEQPEERQPNVSAEELNENETLSNDEGAGTGEDGQSKESLQKLLNDTQKLLNNMTDERDRYISLCLQLKEGKAQSETKAKEQQAKNEKLQSDCDKASDQIRDLEEKNKCLETELQEMRTKMTTAEDDPKEPLKGENTKTGLSAERVVNIQTSLDLGCPQTFCVRLDADGLLPLASVQERLQGGQVGCIFYHPHLSPAQLKLNQPPLRLLILEEGKFHPPDDGWGDRVYHAKISQQNPRDLSVRKIPPLVSFLPGMSTTPSFNMPNTPPLLPTPQIKLPNPNASLVQILYALPLIPSASRFESYAQYFQRISPLLEPVVPLLSSGQKQLLEDYLQRNFNSTLPLFS